MTGLYSLYDDGGSRRRRPAPARSRYASAPPADGGVRVYGQRAGNEPPTYRSETEMAQALIANNPHLDQEAKAALELQYRSMFPDSGTKGVGTFVADPNQVRLKGARHALLMQLENDRARRERRKPAFPTPTGASYYINFQNGG